MDWREDIHLVLIVFVGKGLDPFRNMAKRNGARPFPTTIIHHNQAERPFPYQVVYHEILASGKRKVITNAGCFKVESEFTRAERVDETRAKIAVVGAANV
jgi:hypothetical protein